MHVANMEREREDDHFHIHRSGLWLARTPAMGFTVTLEVGKPVYLPHSLHMDVPLNPKRVGERASLNGNLRRKVADFVQERQRRYAGEIHPLLSVPMGF
jgi:hypothetical protein